MSVLVVKTDRRGERVLTELGDISKATRRGIRQGFFNLGRDLKFRANAEILRRPKGGRVYLVRGPRGRIRRHVASAPGETHANLTGALRRSIGWQVNGHESMDFGYGVGNRKKNQAPEYSPFVEFGTNRMEERPSLNNAIDASQRDAERNFLEGITKELME